MNRAEIIRELIACNKPIPGVKDTLDCYADYIIQREKDARFEVASVIQADIFRESST